MKTRITTLFGIRHPLICPGMTYVSNANLVAAVSNAGGLGILAVGHLSAAETRAEIRRTRTLTDQPFGVGIALIMPGAAANADVAIEEQVPVINFSLGSGDGICARVHAYGGKVIATVVNEKHAKAAEKAGVDALLVTGHEAAAHGGAVTSLVLLPAIRQVTSLPIIAAGGFATGGSLIAALALGADAIAMGTRFAATRESPVHGATKKLITEKTVNDTLYSANFDGMPCRVMKTPAAEKRMVKRLTVWRVVFRALRAIRGSGRPLSALLHDLRSRDFAEMQRLAYFGAATEEIRRATVDGNIEAGIQLIGQVQGLVQDVPAVAALVARVMDEAETTLTRINSR